MDNSDATVGAMEIGSLLSVFLFGIVTLQTHIYYSRYEDDRWQYRVLVGLLWVLEFAHTFCVSAEVYSWTIKHFGKPEKLDHLPFLAASISTGGTITAIVHNCFAFRIWKILPGPFNYSAVIIAAFATARGGLTVYVSAIGMNMNATDFQRKHMPIILTLLSANVVLDTSIATAMLWYLIGRRGKAMRRTTRLIDHLINYTIRSGLLTGIAATLILIFEIIWPNTLIWLAPYAVLAKLYSNSLLSSLNERAALRADLAGGSFVGSLPGQWQCAPGPYQESNLSTGARIPISMEINTSTHCGRVSFTEIIEKHPQTNSTTPSQSVRFEMDSVPRLV